ncbi:transcription factor Opi1-domain-containing protein [Mycena haematopus]|nr:transcription factor Opi1-domain-containing protein [Mycena haematopus]
MDIDSLEMEDDVRIAVRALGQMRSGHSNTTSTTHTPALSLSLPSTHPADSPPHTPPLVEEDADNDQDATGSPEVVPMDAETERYPSLARMQSLPLVSGALRVYDTAKTNSRVVQYTSSLVSSSLRHGTSLLPAGSGERIDEFAGGMLDRLDKYRRAPASTPPPPLVTPTTTGGRKKKKTLDGGVEVEREGTYETRRRGGYAYGADEDEGGRRAGGKRRWGADEREDEYDYEEGEVGAKGSRMEEARRAFRGGWKVSTSPFVAAPGPPPPLGRSKPKPHHAHATGRDSGLRSTSRRGAERETERERERGQERETEMEQETERGRERERERDGDEHQVAVAQRSRWQAVLLEAGGLSAALSDESMRRLRYCLSWLQYATQHIDAQILILRDFIASLHPPPPPATSTTRDADDDAYPPPPPELTPDHLRTLSHLRSDIVHTIRQVVGVVSKYAGGALPEPARGRVRGFILDLPKRFSAEGGGGASSAGGSSGGWGAVSPGAAGSSTWAAGTTTRRGGAGRSQRGTGAGGGGDAMSSPTASAPGSPHAHLRPLHGHTGKALAAAQRVLVLATESLDMMRGVTAVVGDSLDRADAWVDRLRTVGIQRGMDGLALPDGHGEHAWATGATPAWPGPPRSPGYASTSGSGARSPASPYGYAGSASPAYASGSGASPAYGSGAPSPGFGMGGMSLGSSRYSTPAPGEDERERDVRERERDVRERDVRERKRGREREREEGGGRMEVDG